MILRDKRVSVRSKLATFPGETREIDGRTYLRFGDYAGWKGQAVKGKLRKEPGILPASWNGWRAAHGDASGLAGVPDGSLECWATGYRHMVHGPDEARQLAVVRMALLERLRTRTLHDFDAEPRYFSRKGAMHKRSFLEETAVWREEALAFGSQVFTLRPTLNRVSERYFDGTPVILTGNSSS